MAETANKASMSIVVTTSEKLSSLLIKNGQLVFIKDKGRIAFDFNDKRTFYNQITELETDYERASLSSPSDGYYFVIDTAVLWHYQNGWIQITSQPEDIVFIGTELPELGLGKANEKTLYVDKTKKEILVYDSAVNKYVVVADKSDVSSGGSIETVTDDDINSLF